MRPHILLVDDDRELDLMLTEYLSAEPFSIVTATDGTKALDLLTKENFDLVILDVMLPSLNGFDVLAQAPAGSYRPCDHAHGKG